MWALHVSRRWLQRKALDRPFHRPKKLVLGAGICCPHPPYAQLVGTRDSVDEPYANRPHLLGHHLSLRFDKLAMVGSYELAPLDENCFPFPRRLGIQAVLVDIGRDDGFGLDVDEVFPSI